jgi:hypothetical protein
VTGDDQSGFKAPRMQKPTPTAVKLAGQRVHRWAVDQEGSGAADASTPLFDRTPPDDQELARDFRLMRWYAENLEEP